MLDQKHSKDDIEGSMYMEEINSIRIEKLGNRITIFCILLPCFIAIALFFAYMDINEKLATVNITGKTEVKTISDTLESKINSMIVDQARLKHLLDIKLPEMKKATDSLNNDMVKLASLKADKNYIKNEIKKITSSVAILKKKLNTLSKSKAETLARMNKADEKLEKNIKEIGLSLKKDIAGTQESIKKNISGLKNLNSSISSLRKNMLLIDQQIKIISKEKIGKKEFNTKFKDLKKEYNKKINNLILLKGTENTKKKKITGHKSKPVKSISEKAGLKPATGSGSSVPKTGNKIELKHPAEEKVPNIPEIKPGKIIEQNLSQ